MEEKYGGRIPTDWWLSRSFDGNQNKQKKPLSYLYVVNCFLSHSFFLDECFFWALLIRGSIFVLTLSFHKVFLKHKYISPREFYGILKDENHFDFGIDKEEII